LEARLTRSLGCLLLALALGTVASARADTRRPADPGARGRPRYENNSAFGAPRVRRAPEGEHALTGLLAGVTRVCVVVQGLGAGSVGARNLIAERVKKALPHVDIVRTFAEADAVLFFSAAGRGRAASPAAPEPQSVYSGTVIRVSENAIVGLRRLVHHDGDAGAAQVMGEFVDRFVEEFESANPAAR
jgi:hypothetical protein